MIMLDRWLLRRFAGKARAAPRRQIPPPRRRRPCVCLLAAAGLPASRDGRFIAVVYLVTFPQGGNDRD